MRTRQGTHGLGGPGLQVCLGCTTFAAGCTTAVYANLQHKARRAGEWTSATALEPTMSSSCIWHGARADEGCKGAVFTTFVVNDAVLNALSNTGRQGGPDQVELTHDGKIYDQKLQWPNRNRSYLALVQQDSGAGGDWASMHLNLLDCLIPCNACIIVTTII